MLAVAVVRYHGAQPSGHATASINELATGYPGYNGNIPFENGFLSEMLLQHGYSTYMVGKWHLMPSEYESGAGPFDRWPLGRGFERFYGFLGGDTSQWTLSWSMATTRSSRRGRRRRVTT